MIVRTWLGRISAVVAGVGIAATFTATGIAATVVKGDAPAWDMVLGAFEKLHALSGYRMKVTGFQDMEMVGEYAGSDFHWAIQGKQMTADIYHVGNRDLERVSGPQVPKTQCRQMTEMRQPITEPRDIEGEITVTRKPDEVIDGKPMHVVAAEWSEHGTSQSGSFYIAADTGLPRRFVGTVPSAKGPVQSTMDFYDYGAPITITLPKC
jgi:hypothetical protein